MLKSLLNRIRRRRPAAPDWRSANATRIDALRRRGVRIGEQCIVLTEQFSTEPYLVELGNHVAVAGGTVFLTHDGSAFLLRATRPEAQHFGRIVVGDWTLIGQNCIILPGARIGARCVIGAGSVVRGGVPDGSVVLGNPATVVGRTDEFLKRLDASADTLDTYSLPDAERERLLRAHFGMM